MVVDNNVHGIGIVQVGLDVVDKEMVGNIRQPLDYAPVFTAVFADLDSAVIGSGIQQAFHHGRF
ncbi:MAG: hypothetical protein DRQ55_20270 [Planctomycetota bacterium]|nr:MAG: hypothetical protein DRQ55_20270 [Planctomycetota bacterium]